ncbi:MAG: sensor histidine kinase [Chitinophagaceae bacterium]
MVMDSQQYTLSLALTKNSMIVVNDFEGKLLSSQEIDIVKRFARVFDQTYTRFLDLQKAEAQAREAQIEASLERVRSRAMAIRKSDELAEVIRIIFQELNKLGFDLIECSIATYVSDSKDLIYWSDGTYGAALPTSVRLQYINHPLLIDLLNDFENGVQYRSGEYSGELLRTWWDRIFIETDFKYAPKEFIESWKQIKQIFYSHAAMNHGFLEFLGDAPLPDDKVEILKRFTKVVDLTYTRFDDVVKAEAQAREAQIELAVERVRAKALAMHRSAEILDVAIVLRNELVSLKIPGVVATTIYLRQENGDVRLWDITSATDTGDGIHFSMNFNFRIEEADPDLWIRKIWDTKENYIVIEQNEKDLHRAIEWTRLYNIETADMTQQFLEANKIVHSWHSVVKLSSGKLVTDFIQAPPAEMESILLKMGASFDLAYTRFHDLQKAEAHAEQARLDLVQIQTEKKRAEDALTELQSTQKQLIQSEKMASLGELTAGIAHEIQNPLNFVNNFSEVSKELLDEMKTELDKGNTEDAKEIMNDVIQNLEKINHHGKRADGIVKGMLQHSRSSSGVKEPTDINALCDEYLRLSYHGLRAKEKSFNASFKTDFDASIGNINIIPQDIGRVILNLLTNAFYVVNEKKTLRQAQGDTHYEPTVTISTKKIGDKVEIKVTDNGNGIPQKVLDKIFQPFFTTKPTGQGTGLGLSLSYDIVKAHGGELKVETKEGEGSTFIIQIPTN